MTDPTVCSSLAEACCPPALRDEFRALPDESRAQLAEAWAQDPIGALSDQDPVTAIEVLADVAQARKADAHEAAARAVGDELYRGTPEATAKQVALEALEQARAAIDADLEVALKAFETSAAQIFNDHDRDRFEVNGGTVRQLRGQIGELVSDPDALEEWLQRAVKHRGKEDHATAVACERELRALRPPPPPERKGHKAGGFTAMNDERDHRLAVERHHRVRSLLESHIAQSEPEGVRDAKDVLAAVAAARAGKSRYRHPREYTRIK